MRHDHGSQYMSDDFHAELRFLGIVASPAFVRQPDGNGCIERFFRTLKEQLRWVRHFTDVEDLQQARLLGPLSATRGGFPQNAVISWSFPRIN